jgi:signal transduction histidine kinase
MKKKLNILFVLISLSLLSIIIFQIYWTFNAYKVNKEKFDNNIDAALQKAMADCKKDYFDSIRVVLVRRLSDPAIKIRIDTLHEADTVHKQLSIYIQSKHSDLGEPFHIISTRLDYYRSLINHKATLPEVLTEASFYTPELMNDWMLLLGMDDITDHQGEMLAYLKAHSNIPSDSIMAHKNLTPYGIYALPKNYRQSDSIKLHNYFEQELDKMHMHSSFDLQFALHPTSPQKFTISYSETNEYSYKYHGFVFLHIRGDEFFVRATFGKVQYAVLKSMLAPLLLSIFLMLFTIYSFNYIIRLVIHQNRLAELKDDFINNMTHELKTPIATITVAIEGLQKFNALNDVEKTQRYLQTSRAELSKLNNLVSKVLNIAAFENKDVDLVKEMINVDELINDMITSEQLKADKKVKFTYVNKDNIKVIYADKLHFGNVLNNIIDNAIKYTNEPVDIIITCFKQNNNAVFSVKDNGMGIPAGHISQIFDKFHRVPAGNVHNVKGTGLGLSYSKYIIEAHGGTIAVKSEINAGSEFIVSIPLSNG